MHIIYSMQCIAPHTAPVRLPLLPNLEVAHQASCKGAEATMHKGAVSQTWRPNRRDLLVRSCRRRATSPSRPSAAFSDLTVSTRVISKLPISRYHPNKFWNAIISQQFCKWKLTHPFITSQHPNLQELSAAITSYTFKSMSSISKSLPKLTWQILWFGNLLKYIPS